MLAAFMSGLGCSLCRRAVGIIDMPNSAGTLFDHGAFEPEKPSVKVQPAVKGTRVVAGEKRRVFGAKWQRIMLIGYARTSTEDQLAGLDAQVAALKAEGCEKLFRERVSAAAQREQLEVALAWAREGDTLVVTTMDRLARSAQHLLEIVEGLERKRVALRLLDFEGHKVDTNSRQGKLVLTMFAAFAHFEREVTLERQQEGTAKANVESRKGRKPTAMAKADEVKALAADGVGPSEIARKLGIGRTSVHRVLHG